jgi:hypothetical protein
MQGELAGHDMMLGDGVIEQGLEQRSAFSVQLSRRRDGRRNAARQGRLGDIPRQGRAPGQFPILRGRIEREGWQEFEPGLLRQVRRRRIRPEGPASCPSIREAARTAAAPRFSHRRRTFVVPGIGTMQGFCASSHARAQIPSFHPIRDVAAHFDAD